MRRHRFRDRTIALIAAYALALQALLSAAALSPHAANATLTLSSICIGDASGGLPADGNPASCKLHCLLVGSATGALPPSAGVAAASAPPATRLTGFEAYSLPGRDKTHTPQIPRAPPV
jgi:hypothetical protein